MADWVRQAVALRREETVGYLCHNMLCGVRSFTKDIVLPEKAVPDTFVLRLRQMSQM